jgi:hypothetical protein
MKWYLAGPMSGIPQFNFPAFIDAAVALRARGYEIVSPAELDSSEVQVAAMASPTGELDAEAKIAGETWGQILARDVQIVSDEVQGIIFLPNWQKSRGARLEAFVGLLCGHQFSEFYEPDGVRSISPREVANHIHAQWPPASTSLPEAAVRYMHAFHEWALGLPTPEAAELIRFMQGVRNAHHRSAS